PVDPDLKLAIRCPRCLNREGKKTPVPIHLLRLKDRLSRRPANPPRPNHPHGQATDATDSLRDRAQARERRAGNARATILDCDTPVLPAVPSARTGPAPAFAMKSSQAAPGCFLRRGPVALETRRPAIPKRAADLSAMFGPSANCIGCGRPARPRLSCRGANPESDAGPRWPAPQADILVERTTWCHRSARVETSITQPQPPPIRPSSRRGWMRSSAPPGPIQLRFLCTAHGRDAHRPHSGESNERCLGRREI